MSDGPAGQRDESLGAKARRLLRKRSVLIGLATIVLVGVVAFVLHATGASDGFSLVDADAGDWSYLAVFLLVFGDAVFPIFPGETTLNAAATLAADGVLDLGLVILAGALGAIIGDSALYWIARLCSGRIEPQLQKAKENDKVAAALDFLGTSAPMLLIAGRYVPGVRFAVNATMGLSHFPYRRFVLWSAIGGALWAAYTCLLAYAVGTALAEFPLASVVISGFITTAALAVIFVVVRRRRAPAKQPPATPEPT
jgi:membrane-associated protein